MLLSVWQKSKWNLIRINTWSAFIYLDCCWKIPVLMKLFLNIFIKCEMLLFVNVKSLQSFKYQSKWSKKRYIWFTKRVLWSVCAFRNCFMHPEFDFHHAVLCWSLSLFSTPAFSLHSYLQSLKNNPEFSAVDLHGAVMHLQNASLSSSPAACVQGLLWPSNAVVGFVLLTSCWEEPFVIVKLENTNLLASCQYLVVYYYRICAM